MTRRPVCLVLMPMYAGFEAVRAAVAGAIDGAGLGMRRLEVEIPDSAWHLWLLDSIAAADLALVDLTGHNPFVMYELGYIHSRQLPTAFIVNAADRRVPATVRGAAFTPYAVGGPQLAAAVEDELRSLMAAAPLAVPLLPLSSAELYAAATLTADAFDKATGGRQPRVDATEFTARLTVAQRRGDPDPRMLPGSFASRRLLALILDGSDQVAVAEAIVLWSLASPGSGPVAV